MLALTESPGTARRLQEFCRSQPGLRSSNGCQNIASTAFGDDLVCMATLGYVLVPPESLNPLALYADEDTHPGTALLEERLVRHPDVLRRILDAARQTDHIILATDPDEEGEVIAQDLSMIFTEVGLGDVPATRLCLYGLDGASIRGAFAAAESVHLSTMATDWPPALPGHTRRIVDRWIAGSLGTQEQPVGRVIAGFLEAAQRDERYVAPTFASGTPAHLGDLLLADELMDVPVQGITGALQSLYEAGRVSYPRTDSHNLVARHQHSHTALHLLGTSSQKAEIRDMAYMEPPGMPLESRILCAVARREMAAEGEDVFPAKPVQSADPMRHTQNLRERAVLRVLLAHGLGRPSTWSGFATKHAHWVTETGILTDPGRRAASWQPKAPGGVQTLGLSFQKGFRAFLESLPGTGGTAGRYAMDALKLLDDETITLKMMDSLEAKPSGWSPHDWRKFAPGTGEVDVGRERHDNETDMLS
ncbi:MAG: toprim domain-containing protein [Acidithiobacillus sp.]